MKLAAVEQNQHALLSPFISGSLIGPEQQTGLHDWLINADSSSRSPKEPSENVHQFFLGGEGAFSGHFNRLYIKDAHSGDSSVEP